MELKKYPEPSNDIFKSSKTIKGISAVAFPLLDESKNEEYFGVELLDKGILAVYISIMNNNPNTSFLLSADSVRIAHKKPGNMEKLNPSSIEKEIGDAATGSGALFLGTGALVVAAPLIILGAVESSDASIIKENFDLNKLQTKTIDPGERASGFSYFKWVDYEEITEASICFELNEPIKNVSFFYCLNIDLGK